MIAQKVAARIEDKTVGLDPTIILTIVSIIGALFELYKNCKKSPTMASVGRLERWHLRRAIKAKINDSEMYGHIGHDIYDGMLSLSQEDVDSEFSKYVSGPVSWAKTAGLPDA